MDGDFACAGAEHEAAHADEIAYVEQFLEHDVVEVFVFVGADVIAADVDLHAAVAVLKFNKGGFTHNAPAHDASGHGDLARGLEIVVEVIADFIGVAGDDEFGCRVGFNAERAHLLERIAAYLFLL